MESWNEVEGRSDDARVDGIPHNLVCWPAIEIKIYGLTWTGEETPRRSFHGRFERAISWLFAASPLSFWIKFHAPLETAKKTIVITFSR